MAWKRDLDSDFPRKHAMVRCIDHTHAALAQHRRDAEVFREASPRGEQSARGPFAASRKAHGRSCTHVSDQLVQVAVCGRGKHTRARHGRNGHHQRDSLAALWWNKSAVGSQAAASEALEPAARCISSAPRACPQATRSARRDTVIRPVSTSLCSPATRPHSALACGRAFGDPRPGAQQPATCCRRGA